LIKLRSRRFSWPLLASLVPFCLTFSGFCRGQILYQDQEIQVHNLPSLKARSHDASDILLTSLDTILHNRDVCCGKNSALEDSLAAADPMSLKDVASKVQGQHRLSDGRAITVTAEYLTPDTASAGHLVALVLDQHAALMEWDSHVYVLHGLVFFWGGDTGEPAMVIRKLLLWDTRYTDSRREVVFTRGVDDANKVAGLLFVQAGLP
jgi:hypothetical protein